MRHVVGILIVVALLSRAVAFSQQTALTSVNSSTFNVKAAVDAYLASVPPDARVRSDAYFEGGYWLILWDFLYGAAVAWILLSLRLSARMRDLAERVTRLRPLQTAVYWIEFLVITTVLTFPLTVYEGFVRERKYGLMNQTFGAWFGDQMKSLAVGVVLGSILATILFGVVRRLPRTWWIWGALVSIVFLMLTLLVAPIYSILLRCSTSTPSSQTSACESRFSQWRVLKGFR